MFEDVTSEWRFNINSKKNTCSIYKIEWKIGAIGFYDDFIATSSTIVKTWVLCVIDKDDVTKEDIFVTRDKLKSV